MNAVGTAFTPVAAGGIDFPEMPSRLNTIAMSVPPTKFKRTQERTFSAHHMLRRVAKLSLTEAEDNERGRNNNTLIAITFSALAVEAVANAIGERIVKDWKDFESLSPLAKLRLLTERVGLEYDPDDEPWNTLRWLGKFRNRIAHPKIEYVVDESVINEHEANQRTAGPPESKLEKDITVGNARRAVEAVDRAIETLFEKIPIDEKFGIWTDGWLTSTQRHE